MKPVLHPLDDPSLLALDALLAYFKALHHESLDDTGMPPHVVARAMSVTAPAAAAAWTLGSFVLARAMRSPRSPTDEELGAATAALGASLARALHDVERADPARRPPGKGSSRQTRARSLESAAQLLGEIGLAEHGVEAVLATERDGTRLVLTMPLTEAAVAVRLLDPLYAFLELQALGSAVLEMERRASAWWFDCWSAKPPGQSASFAHRVREREFSLVDREAIDLGASFASAFAGTPAGGRLPPLQRRLLDSLMRSVVSLFVVRLRDGTTATLEDLEDGRRYTVREHNDEVSYAPGFIGAGRLLPFSESTWLRSPGMVLWRPPKGGGESIVGEALGTLDRFPRAVAVEAMISTLALGTRVPRTIPPAASRAEAQDLLWAFNVAMEEAGLAREAGAAEAPPELRAFANGLGRKILELPLDEPLAEWVGALFTQSGMDMTGKGSGRQRTSRPSASAKKKRRR